MPSIGVFDSGIGGLTVASSIVEKNPNQSLIYVGDTAYLPYGDKSEETIVERVHYILHFLVSKGCQTIVAACNSASSVLEKVTIPPAITLINVIDPVVSSISAHFYNKTIGVIGTRRTISSGIYQTKIAQKFPEAKTVAMATPLLAPLIEEGFITDKIADEIIEEYLTRMGNVDALILGCTHYPLIQDKIDRFYQGKVKLLDAPSQVSEIIERVNIRGDVATKNQFFVSDFTQSFQETASFFFGEEIDLRKI